jgi:hypothetical protein
MLYDLAVLESQDGGAVKAFPLARRRDFKKLPLGMNARDRVVQDHMVVVDGHHLIEEKLRVLESPCHLLEKYQLTLMGLGHPKKVLVYDAGRSMGKPVWRHDLL